MEGSFTIIRRGNLPNISNDPRGGDEQHGFASGMISSVVDKIDANQFLQQIEDITSKVASAAERLKDRLGEFEADEIKISLAVSGDGSVGIATVGAEASIEILFKRKRQ